MSKQTTYAIATHWLRNNYILCNNIFEIDPSCYDNARFDWEDEEGNGREFFQYLLTDASKDDVEWLERNFPELCFTYSDLLDCFVLCVDHCGTSWNYVATAVSDDLLKYNPDIEYVDSCYPPRFENNRTLKKGGKND